MASGLCTWNSNFRLYCGGGLRFIRGENSNFHTLFSRLFQNTHSPRSLLAFSLRIKAFSCWKPSFLRSLDTRGQFRIPDTSNSRLVAVISSAGNSCKTGPPFFSLGGYIFLLQLLLRDSPISLFYCAFAFRLRLGKPASFDGGALATRTPPPTSTPGSVPLTRGSFLVKTGGFALIISSLAFTS